MKKQRGFSLGSLMLWGLVLFFVAVGAMKVLPTVLEYSKILKDSKAAVAQAGSGATVADVRKAYDRFASVDQLDFPSDQLEISKEGGQIVASFAYEKRIPLFANVSLLIEYKGSTSAAGKE